MRSIGDILMGLLLADETPAYNLYGLFRFHSDLMSLNEFATQSGIPGMEVGPLNSMSQLSAVRLSMGATITP